MFLRSCSGRRKTPEDVRGCERCGAGRGKKKTPERVRGWVYLLPFAASISIMTGISKMYIIITMLCDHPLYYLHSLGGHTGQERTKVTSRNEKVFVFPESDKMDKQRIFEAVGA